MIFSTFWEVFTAHLTNTLESHWLLRTRRVLMNALSCRTVSLWCMDDTQSWGGETRMTAAGWFRLVRWLDTHVHYCSFFRHQTRNLITFCQIQCCIIVFSWSEYLMKNYFRRPLPWHGIWNSKISILVPANISKAGSVNSKLWTATKQGYSWPLKYWPRTTGGSWQLSIYFDLIYILYYLRLPLICPKILIPKVLI